MTSEARTRRTTQRLKKNDKHHPHQAQRAVRFPRINLGANAETIVRQPHPGPDDRHAAIIAKWLDLNPHAAVDGSLNHLDQGPEGVGGAGLESACEVAAGIGQVQGQGGAGTGRSFHQPQFPQLPLEAALGEHYAFRVKRKGLATLAGTSDRQDASEFSIGVDDQREGAMRHPVGVLQRRGYLHYGKFARSGGSIGWRASPEPWSRPRPSRSARTPGAERARPAGRWFRGVAFW